MSGLSHREVEAFLVKEWRATAPAPAKMPCSSDEKSSGPGLRLEQAEAPAPSTPEESLAAKTTPVSMPLPRIVVRPISAEANRVSVTLSAKTLENLRRAKELLGGRSEDEILFRALEKLLDQVAPERRHARRQKKRMQRAEKVAPLQEPAGAVPDTDASTSRRGRLADRDKVMVDGDCRCAFTAEDGRRCDARVFLEIDHIQLWALGGPSVPENERPLCRTHNTYFAERTFGLWSHENRRN